MLLIVLWGSTPQLNQPSSLSGTYFRPKIENYEEIKTKKNTQLNNFIIEFHHDFHQIIFIYKTKGV